MLDRFPPPLAFAGCLLAAGLTLATINIRKDDRGEATAALTSLQPSRQLEYQPGSTLRTVLQPGETVRLRVAESHSPVVAVYLTAIAGGQVLIQRQTTTVSQSAVRLDEEDSTAGVLVETTEGPRGHLQWLQTVIIEETAEGIGVSFSAHLGGTALEGLETLRQGFRSWTLDTIQFRERAATLLAAQCAPDSAQSRLLTDYTMKHLSPL